MTPREYLPDGDDRDGEVEESETRGDTQTDLSTWSDDGDDDEERMDYGHGRHVGLAAALAQDDVTTADEAVDRATETGKWTPDDADEDAAGEPRADRPAVTDGGRRDRGDDGGSA